MSQRSTESVVSVLRLRTTSERLSGSRDDNSNSDFVAVKIPLRIPLFDDPRTMTRRQLITELTDRKLNPNGQNNILSARLLKAIMIEGLTSKLDPHSLDDHQPEKWMHLANVAFQEACEIEQDPISRGETMERSNSWIKDNISDQIELLEVARGSRFPDNESPLFFALLRFGAGLMLEPIVEEGAVRAANVDSEVVRGSVFISQLRTGFVGLPDHLTKEQALIDEQAEQVSEQKQRKRRRINIQYDEDHDDSGVELGREISVAVGGRRQVKARVTAVKAGNKGHEDNNTPSATIYAKPVTALFAGSHFEFEMNLEEYKTAIVDNENETLEAVTDLTV